jgi:hypothetical protein
MKWRLALYTLLAIVVFYILSFGPGLYVIIKNERMINQTVPDEIKKPVQIVYVPHVYLMALSESYYNYCRWWVTTAGERMNKTYPQFRENILK